MGLWLLLDQLHLLVLLDLWLLLILLGLYHLLRLVGQSLPQVLTHLLGLCLQLLQLVP